MDLTSLSRALAVIGAALGAFGAALGISLIGSKAMDAIARQPAEKKDIRTNMILMAALIEGLAFFVAIIALLVIFSK
ncbi:MAG: ATP synthase F0 subunit C [Spirochaetes bacterium GWF1_41_5]|nr:MAG: ATP synthase F0 subunit C [Spirochaetes bacterium GWF1_41_5]HBE03471.1 ATP synthase F0 subunit C [Spirochaetia bacterium]